MMQLKKFIAVTLFGFSVLSLSQAFAASPAKQVMEKTVQPIEVLAEKSHYVLPFPGLLPDHPLYFLKNFRDFLLDKLIVDPIRRSEFYLLQADKKLAMTIAFIEMGNISRAQDVLTKSGKHMEQSVAGLVNLKTQGKGVPGYVIDRITSSLVKHEEVLGEILQKMQGKQIENFTSALALIKTLQGEAGKLK